MAQLTPAQEAALEAELDALYTKDPIDIELDQLYGTVKKPTAEESKIMQMPEYARRSARMAEMRPNMREEYVNEFWRNPREGKGFIKGEIEGLKQVPGLVLKGMGAATQPIEAAASAPLVALQRRQMPWEGSFYNTIGRSISGEAPTEMCDIYRNMGFTEPAAAALGLITAGGLPGLKQISTTGAKIVGATRQRVATAAGKIATTAESLVHTALTRKRGPGVTYSQARGFDFASRTKSAETIAAELDSAIDDAANSVKLVQKDLSAKYGRAVKEYGNDVLGLRGQNEEHLIIGNTLKELKDSGQIKIVNSRIIKGDKLTTGSDKLAAVLNEMVDTGDSATIYQMFRWRTRLNNIAKSNAVDDGVRAASISLLEGTRGVMNSHPIISAINKEYGELASLVDPFDAQRTIGAIDLFKVRSTGKTQTHRYWDLDPKSKTLLENLNRKMPEGREFLPRVQKAAAEEMYASWAPSSQISLLGGAAAMYSLGQGDIGRAAALSTAVGASVPRIAALMGRYMRKPARAVTNLMNSPMGEAFDRLAALGIYKGVVDPMNMHPGRQGYTPLEE